MVGLGVCSGSWQAGSAAGKRDRGGPAGCVYAESLLVLCRRWVFPSFPALAIFFEGDFLHHLGIAEKLWKCLAVVVQRSGGAGMAPILQIDANQLFQNHVVKRMLARGPLTFRLTLLAFIPSALCRRPSCSKTLSHGKGAADAGYGEFNHRRLSLNCEASIENREPGIAKRC